MGRTDDFAVIREKNTHRFPLEISDLTPNGPLLNPGDIGPPVKVPGGGRVGYVHAERGLGAGLGDARCDYANNPDGNWALNQWRSTDLTDPNTGDGFPPLMGGGYIRLRLGENHTPGVPITATANWG